MSSAGTYSFFDRVLHHLALGNLELQKSLADMEDRTHTRAIREVQLRRPVFITSLPRAGTTLLLELLVGSGAFAAHTYRDMPFVLCPLTWRSIARNFRRAGKPRERAHGDGMTVDFDSPEAFEEVIWKAFWPNKYADGRIRAWTAADRDSEFELAFRDHMRKVILLRSESSAQTARYVSKNNANIARLPLLTAMFADSTIVIPFRNPAEHAGSLARQHANFLALHRQDRFARKYMEWIGHYEFGEAFRPFEFCPAPRDNGTDFSYWLDYWANAYRHVLEHAPAQAVFLDYDGLCEDPKGNLEKLADMIGIASEVLARQAGRLRSSRPIPESGRANWPSHVRTVYEQLLDRSALHAAYATTDAIPS